MENNIQDELGGTIDVIGLDVIKLNKKVDELTIESAKEAVSEATKEIYDILETDDEQFVIRTTISNINKAITILPEDMEQNISMRIQFKIADILSKAGLNVSTSNEMIEEAKEEVDTAIDTIIEENKEDSK